LKVGVNALESVEVNTVKTLKFEKGRGCMTPQLSYGGAAPGDIYKVGCHLECIILGDIVESAYCSDAIVALGRVVVNELRIYS